MGIVRMGPPNEIICSLQDTYGIKKFIETGTYQGNTTYWASQVFEHVLTIEYSESIYKQVQEKYSYLKNVDFFYGDTKVRLNEIVSKLDTPSIFWLDAHWSGGATYGEADQCPLIEEIKIINRSEYDHFIFIDDARLFMSPPPAPLSIEQWPDISTVLTLLNSIKNRYIVIIEDVIFAVPSFAKWIVAQYCQDVNTKFWQSLRQPATNKIVDMNKDLTNSELNRLIPPEIKNDEFYAALQRIAREENIKTALEIGSSSGEGSTEAIVTGLRQNPSKPTLFCMEVSQTRFAELKKRYANDSFVKCYNISSVSLQQFPDENEVINFYTTVQTNLNSYPLDIVIDWLRQDIKYVKNSGVPENGIKKIKQENNIDSFDLVLIDGSEFTGSAELTEVYEAKLICLDDINTFKNYRNHQKLLADQNFVLLAQDYSIRNGYSIFKRVNKVKNYLVEHEIAEQLLVSKLVLPGMVVFDVGANIGIWTKEVLSRCPSVKIHLFEPVPENYRTLLHSLDELIKAKEVIPNNFALSDKEETRNFYHYEDFAAWSTFHRRVDIEKQYNLKPPKSFPVLATTLDAYSQQVGVNQINFLKIDTEGGELDVLHGAKYLLKRGKIDYLQFEYGGTFLDAKITLREVFEYLQHFRYAIFKILPSGLEHIPCFQPQYENFQYSNFLAVNERFRANILGEAPKMLDLDHLCKQYSVTPRGVIHVGAYEGKEEIALYQAMGVEKVLFIEANPVVFERLKVNIAGIPNMQAVNCAISNLNGTVNLHVTSMDQSSSILALKLHQELYPNIKETHQVTVESRTLDTLLQELQLQPSDFNIINIDIQGAELFAFQGATNVLKHFEAINTEVNYKELYKGCALVDQIDEFLDIHGFERVATTTPYHPSWGDAFYMKKPVITMSTLGTNGRFANQLFQYAFLKIYAKEHDLQVETSEWIGQYLFGHNDPPISKQLPVVVEQTNILSKARIPNTKELFKNVDFWGYFQYHTQYYTPHKEYFCSLFKPVTEIEMQLSEALNRLRSRGKTLVGLHLRRGDYGYQYFFVAPSEWYKEWLRDLWETLDEPILFIASDEPEKVINDFVEYNPVTVKDLGVELPEAEFYPDSYFLSNCDIVAISNSSFSFVACMLNQGGKLFFRPDLQAEKLIRFEPWDSEVILRDTELPALIPNNTITRVAHQFSGLPIHFFTIVLNGEPFIRYHIDVFKQLPFQWHWHIIEGVADLKHDTAWSLRNGGRVTDEVHRNGHSNDGTTEYLDELARLYPVNVTLYRKPEGVFWDGKREMVNAPLANINEECLLWQVDADELWTVEQICTARQMFINNPDKTAAFYWCWYFVGENLVISTRNCYAQNPQQEWLRTWRFQPRAVWAAHEPPRLAEPLLNGQWRDVAAVNPFLHEETEQMGLIFQHFAYVTPEQLRFKEQYYGYTNAASQWMQLQAQAQFPVLLSQYFPWVQDATQVDTANSCGVVPIAQREDSSEVWRFLQLEELQKQPAKIEKLSPTIIVDGVFFQLYKTGIARVWRSLLEEWAVNRFAKHIVVLDRAGTAPKIPGLRYYPVQPYDYGRTDADREMLQQVCNEEGADLFISTYYTTPISTPSVFMAYDMIPEVVAADLSNPMWREKHYAIQHASAYITISDNTARDLVKFFPHISPESVTVAVCGVKSSFLPASQEEINSFRTKYGISKPYFIMVGAGSGYKNSILFFQAFSHLCSRQGFDIICTGSGGLLEAEFRNYTSGSVVHMLQLSDEELSTAYSGAGALVYPSKYEGFGLPILEAITCGCPVITCPNASIPEVAGEAALYVNDNDVDGMFNALCDVQKPGVRNSLIAAGLEQAKKFSWLKMAETVSSALIDATLLPLNLKDINLIVFPDWSQPEESLCFDLEQVIRVIATHPDSSQMTLLVDTGNVPDEDAALILSSITMNLLLQEDLDVSEGPEISLIGQLGEIQWEALLPRIHARISLENENKQAIASVRAENIPSCELNSFSDEQAAQLKTDIWDVTGHSEIFHFNRGKALQKQGKFAEAVSSYQKALEIKPDFAEARYQLSITRYQNQVILKGYQFTQDWFSHNIPTWEEHLKHFINIPTLNVLEIGSWEGRSTCWLLDNIMTHEANRITCIDTFEGSVEHRHDTTYIKSIEEIQSIEGRFDFNIARTGVLEKVQKLVGKSQSVLRTLPLNSYDIVYIDGSHVASDVLEDAVLAWQLVKIGGLIIFDDYPFTFPQNYAWNTKVGIDAFMRTFIDKFRVIYKAYQIILEKTS